MAKRRWTGKGKAAKAKPQLLNLHIEGTEELQKKLDKLESKIAKKIIRKAVGKGLTPIRKAARGMVAGRRRTGMLHRSLATRVKVYRSGAVWGGVGTDVQKSAEFPRYGKVVPSNYAHLVELGTKPHSLKTRVDTKMIRRGMGIFPSLAAAIMKRAGQDPGVMTARYRDIARRQARDYLYRRDKLKGFRTHPGSRPYPFLNPAMQQQKASALQIIAAELRAGIEAAAKGAG